MSTTSKIEWTDASWPVTVGCSKVSAGCDGCYAIPNSFRLAHNPNPKISTVYEDIAHRTPDGLDFTGVVRCLPERLDWPLRWRKPRRVFVCSMSDLFHADVPREFIAEVFWTMSVTPRHTYQILTKRPGRMRALLNSQTWIDTYVDLMVRRGAGASAWPLPNVWLGVSVEDQEAADKRIPILLETPAAVRFLSCEPLLGPVDLSDHLSCTRLGCREFIAGHPTGHPSLHWVIVGGESGPGARPMDVQWARDLVGQCRDAGTPVFVKQLGSHPGFRLEDEVSRGNAMPSFHHYDHGAGLYIKAMDDRKGGDPSEWPEDLRVREMPEVARG